MSQVVGLSVYSFELSLYCFKKVGCPILLGFHVLGLGLSLGSYIWS